MASLSWNSYRHLELYFCVPAIGCVLHTLNLRLADDQLAYIINHAGDKVLFVDDSLLPVLARLRALIPRNVGDELCSVGTTRLVAKSGQAQIAKEAAPSVIKVGAGGRSRARQCKGWR